jgi:lysophospholipase L1-like esterase
MNPALKAIWQIIQKDYQNKVAYFKKYAKKVDHLIVGDSMVAYYKPTLNIHKQGIAGDTTEGVLKRIDVIHLYQPNKVFLHIGTNDVVFTNDSDIEIVHRIQTIIDQLQAYDVYFILPLPVDPQYFQIKDQPRTNARLYSLKTLLLEKIKHATMIDMYDAFLCHGVLCKQYHSDGLHLNEKGYGLYETLIKNHL